MGDAVGSIGRSSDAEPDLLPLFEPLLLFEPLADLLPDREPLDESLPEPPFLPGAYVVSLADSLLESLADLLPDREPLAMQLKKYTLVLTRYPDR